MAQAHRCLDGLAERQLLAVHLAKVCEEDETVNGIVSVKKDVIQFFVDHNGFPNLNSSVRRLPHIPTGASKIYVRIEVRLASSGVIPWPRIGAITAD